jgi:Ca2+/H+ antiporter
MYTNESLINACFVLFCFVLSVATKNECNIESEKQNESERSQIKPEKESTLKLEDREEEEGNVPMWKGVVYLLIGGVLIGLFSESFIQYVHTVEIATFREISN